MPSPKKDHIAQIGFRNFVVYCRNVEDCGAEGPQAVTKIDAATAWNDRRPRTVKPGAKTP